MTKLPPERQQPQAIDHYDVPNALLLAMQEVELPLIRLSETRPTSLLYRIGQGAMQVFQSPLLAAIKLPQPENVLLDHTSLLAVINALQLRNVLTFTEASYAEAELTYSEDHDRNWSQTNNVRSWVPPPNITARIIGEIFDPQRRPQAATVVGGGRIALRKALEFGFVVVMRNVSGESSTAWQPNEHPVGHSINEIMVHDPTKNTISQITSDAGLDLYHSSGPITIF
jgi:hypothetical protein